jgi:hypothetical protein
MFPFVHLSKRPWIGPGLLMASLVLLSLTTQFLDRPQTPKTDVEYIVDMERHLKSKAAGVVKNFTSEDYTIDLNLVLDTTATTTTTYLPGEKILVSDQEKKESLGANVASEDTQCLTGGSQQSTDGAKRTYNNYSRSQKWEMTGTWSESTDVRPKIELIRCCVTLTGNETIDHDHLYRRLSYALGIDLERGDLLQIVER